VSGSALLVMDVQRGIVERFAGDAEYLLRLRGEIDTLVLAGIATSGVVRSSPGRPT
jgi:nicotinamidase-related amidase